MLGGGENVFNSAAGSRTCKNFENLSKTNVFMSKMNLNRDFALAGEISLDNKFLFCAIFLT